MVDIFKALINLRDGTIQLEGSQTFVEKYLDLYKNLIKIVPPTKPDRPLDLAGAANEKPTKKRGKKASGQSPSPRIIELLQEGYFKEPRTRSDVQAELLNKGYRYEGREVSATLMNYFNSGKLKRKGAGKTAQYYSNPE